MKSSLRIPRFFYSGAALLLLIFMFIGFQQFFLHGRNFQSQELDPTRRGSLIAHGIVMTIWMLLFVVQPALIALGNRKLHRKLGWMGAAVALCATALGVRLAFPIPPFAETDNLFYGMTPRQFNGLILLTAIMFACFVAAGIWKRRTPAIHRSMMMFSVLTTMGAVFDRIPWIVNLYYGSTLAMIFGPYFGSLVFGLLLLGTLRLLTGSWDRWLAIGNVVFALASAFVMLFVKSGAWESLARVLG